MLRVNNIMFDVTDKCNFRCSHCYKEQNVCGTDLSFERIEKFLDNIEKSKECSSIVISGGEPLLYPDLVKLLHRLNGKYTVRVNTNGIFLDEYIEMFQAIANLRVQISLDGYDDETFYQIRNNHGFDKIVQNALMAKQNGLNIYFRATLTSKTIENYEEFIKLSLRTGIPLVIRPLVNTDEIRQKKLKIEYTELVDWYRDVEEKGYLAYTSGTSPLSENSCPLLKEKGVISLLTIDNFGNIYPCSLLRGDKFLLGNLKDEDLDLFEIRVEEAISNLQKIVFSESCQKCGFRKQLGDGTCAVSCYFGNKKCIKKKIYGGKIL